MSGSALRLCSWELEAGAAALASLEVASSDLWFTVLQPRTSEPSGHNPTPRMMLY